MRKFLLSLLMVLCSVAPVASQRLLPLSIEQATFSLSHDTPDGAIFGTGFCVPGKSNTILTASHVVGPGLVAKDYKGDLHEVTVMGYDEKKDIAVLLLKDSFCALNQMKWGPTGQIGQQAWVWGYGGGLTKPILTGGMISSEPSIAKEFPGNQIAQLNALGGHSGGPVIDGQGRVIGMLVGGFIMRDEMDVIVPVEVLKKFVK